MKLSLRLRRLLTTIVTLLIWSQLAWDYFHGGVPTHYLLHDDRFPGIPNWWGAAILPFFTWFLLYRIHKRIDGRGMLVASENLRNIVLRFLSGVLVAVAIAVCFMNGIEVTDYIMGSLFVLAFFFPLYKSEYLLGWVLGAAFTFGAILPMGFGSLLALIFFVFYQLGKAVGGFIRPKTT
ncbi:hypothetical protein [Maribacter arenosus]|uniref:Tripartite tricarboxylate transporter TctB family protein n=1 Tax=Maribacter arenosus TaxID=1854708 RepID=A0ABR7V8Y6_9FLAO|nr:hypothetical protein [Maribacter arenosus]MBD0849300.1 hypothetical protein [Maribacter arenosus]